MRISISDEVRERCPKVSLGVLRYRVTVEKSCGLWLELFDGKIKELEEKIVVGDIGSMPHIQSTRAAYKLLGKDPHQYRNAAEAMLRRIAKGKGLYHINNVVECNNYISVVSGYSIGSYDMSCLEGDIQLLRAPDGEKYAGIGKDMVNIEHLPTLYDEIGAFGNPTSDSQRAMVELGRHEIISVIYGFDGKAELETWLSEFKSLLIKWCGADSMVTEVI